MTIIQRDLPTDILDLPDQTEDSLRALAQEALIVCLYDLGLVASGWAAHALNLTRRAFLELLGTYGVSEFDEQMDIGAEAQHS